MVTIYILVYAKENHEKIIMLSLQRKKCIDHILTRIPTAKKICETKYSYEENGWFNVKRTHVYEVREYKVED